MKHYPVMVLLLGGLFAFSSESIPQNDAGSFTVKSPDQHISVHIRTEPELAYSVSVDSQLILVALIRQTDH